MPSAVSGTTDDLLPASQVRARYRVSDMTLFRWLADERLGFPQPLRINSRRYWRIADLQSFEVRQSSKQEAA